MQGNGLQLLTEQPLKRKLKKKLENPLPNEENFYDLQALMVGFPLHRSLKFSRVRVQVSINLH